MGGGSRELLSLFKINTPLQTRFVFLPIIKKYPFYRSIKSNPTFLQQAEYFPSGLEWFQILRGTEEAGELLATFEMFELGENSAIIPPLPLEKEVIRTADGKELGNFKNMTSSISH